VKEVTQEIGFRCEMSAVITTADGKVYELPDLNKWWPTFRYSVRRRRWRGAARNLFIDAPRKLARRY